MGGCSPEAETILRERFGRDCVISLATVDNGAPAVRSVNGFYEDGAFYCITHALSGKMRQLEANPAAAVCGEWFTARGKGESLGYFGREENLGLAQKLRKVFAGWIDNGHNDFSDENTVILRVRLEKGVLFSRGARYELTFTGKPG